MAAAAIATAYVLVLVLQLNPALPLHPLRLVPVLSTVGVFYAVHLTAIAYVLLVIRQLLARELFSPAWISVGVLTWLVAIAAAAASIVVWRNLTLFALVLDDGTVAALQRTVLILAATVTACVVAALLRRRTPDARIGLGLLMTIAVGGSIAGPLAIRGRGIAALLEARPIDAPLTNATPERSARVTVIAIDGGSLDFVTSATAQGRLPNFGRLLDAGAVRHLTTIRPTSAEAVWAAASTGKLPQKNGVRSASMYRVAGGTDTIQLLPQFCYAQGLLRLGLLVEEPHASTTFRARTLWSILGTQGFSVGVVAWPLTQPAPTVRGFLVSDGYHRVATLPSGLDDPSTIYPPELQAEALAAMERVPADEAPVLTASLAAANGRETPARVDRMYDSIARALGSIRPAQVMLQRFQSLDPIGHYFLRYAVPSEFGDVSDEERRRLGPVLERHYAIVDEAIGRAIAALGPDDVLLVVSGYGMAPLGFGRRLLERAIGDPEVSGTHENAPDGFLMAYGNAVARGRSSSTPSIVDLTPTVLYFLGLPVGRDMDGNVRTDLFQRSFIDERPITFIPTYDR